jgi:nicotinamidase-related amidase
MTLALPVRHYCAVPSRHPRGLVTTTWQLDPARTALIELHCWNVGVPEGLPVPEEFWVFMGSPQNHDRAAGIVTGVIAPLLDLSRRAGLPIVHVQPESVVKRYVGLPPATPETRPPRPVTDDAVRRANAVHGEGYMAWEGWERLDVAAAVRPRPGDGMVATTEQFDAWLREREITTLLYTGFATNLCILESPAAMKPMRERGYRCVILREATMAVEFPDTLETLAHTRAALRYIEAWVGYSASVDDLRDALSAVT